MLSCIWAPARQLSALPFSSCPVRSPLTLSKQLEQILFYWGFYQVQEIPAALAHKHFLSWCGVLRCHPTRPVRSREFALSFSNWILNQTLERLPSLQPVLWHFKREDKSIFTSGRQTADLTQWKLFCESGFKYSVSSWIVYLNLMNIYPASQQICGRYLIASRQINGLISVIEVATLVF